MKQNILIFIVFVFTFYGCNSNTPSLDLNNKNTISINLDKNDSLSIYDLFDKVELIPLQTDSSSVFNFLLGQPDQVLIYDNKFYFLDKKQSAILLFEKNGSFIKKINKKGKGPGEYSSISDFHINRFTGNLEILSEFGFIIIYDSLGEKYIETIKLPFTAIHYFANISSDLYAFYSAAKGGEILFYSKNNSKEVGTSDYKLPKWLRSTVFSPPRSPFYVFNNDVLFTQVYNGEVSEISGTELNLKSKYYWDFGKKNFNISDIPVDEDENFYFDLGKKIGNKFPNLFLIYAENEDYYFTRFKFKNRYKHLIFVKKNNTYFLFDEFSGGLSFLPFITDEEAAYAFVSPIYLEKLIANKYLDQRNQTILKGIKPDNNLIVIKYIYKK